MKNIAVTTGTSVAMNATPSTSGPSISSIISYGESSEYDRSAPQDDFWDDEAYPRS